MSSTNNGILLTCTTCRQTSVFPRLQNPIPPEGMMSYCSTCGSVTLQRMSGSVPSGATPQHHSNPPTPIYDAPNHTASAALPPSQTSYQQQQQAYSPQQPDVGGAGGSVGGSLSSNDDELYRRFQQSLQQTGMRMADVLHTSGPARSRLIQSLGFHAVDTQRILALVEREKDDTLTPMRGGGGGGGFPPPVGSLASPPSSGIVHRLGGAGAVGTNASPSPMTPPAVTSPLANGGGPPLARCSVYPDLAAEFWCCACGVLVSSRCHVQGVHKDHPFITLRLAAESHVRDLSAWSERCRAQLGVTESVCSNLAHAVTLVQESQDTQYAQLDRFVAQIQDDLLRWREQVRNDIAVQIDAQTSSIQYSIHLATQMYELYNSMLKSCDPLLSVVPGVHQTDRAAEDWSLRILDLVSRLKMMSVEPIPIPKVFVPDVKCYATPATQMELIKHTAVPISVRLPDILDPGYFNFPQPSSSSRVPFTLQSPDDAKSKGVLVYSGRTLTRSQDVLPSHTLVTASQVFYSGVTSWEVHIDRLGAGPGRVLAGLVIHGTDGEGVVWDGQRIVGPNDGECRMIDEKYVLRPGTVLRFVLELDPPQHYLNCFFERDGVARIPLPPTGNGWVPAFSVFGPQDQVTVVPTNSSTRIATIGQAANGGPASKKEEAISNKVSEQEQLIAALQQQLYSVTSRLDSEQYRTSLMVESAIRRTNPSAPPHNLNTSHSNNNGNFASYMVAHDGGVYDNAGPMTYPVPPPAQSVLVTPGRPMAVDFGSTTSPTPSAQNNAAFLPAARPVTLPPTSQRSGTPPVVVVHSATPPNAAAEGGADGDRSHSAARPSNVSAAPLSSAAGFGTGARTPGSLSGGGGAALPPRVSEGRSMPDSGYSNELQSLLKFVEDMKT